MRSILFKAIDVGGKWVEGYYDTLWNSYKAKYVPAIQNFFLGDNVMHTEINSNTLCQFTGLLDMHGNKIFEGDKLYDNENEQECFIVYVEEEAGFSVRFFDDEYFYSFNEIYPSNLEIIGNIHDSEV